MKASPVSNHTGTPWVAQLFVLFLLMIAQTAHALPFEAESTLPLSDDARELDARWEYRLGDSERKPGQAPDWALQDPGKGWLKLPRPTHIPDSPARQNSILWLKVSLPSGTWESPSLLLEAADTPLEIYAAGKLLYSNSAIDPARTPPLLPQSWRIVSLPDAALGKNLLVRMQKNSAALGMGRVFLGAKHVHLSRIHLASLGHLTMGAVSLIIGLFALGMALARSNIKALLPLSGLSLTTGLYMILAAPVSRQIVDAPGFWESGELLFLFLVPAAFAALLEPLLAEKSSQYARRIWQVHIGFVVLAALAAVPGLVPLRRALPLFLLVSALGTSALAAAEIRHSWQRGWRRRALCLGCAATAVLVLADLARGLMTPPTWTLWPSFVQLALMGSLLGFTFLIARRRIQEYLQVDQQRGQLEHAFAGTQDIFRQHETLLAVCKAAESIVRDIAVDALCNATLYIRVWDGEDDSPLFRQSTIVSQGRLVGNPTLKALKQKHEAAAENMLTRPTPIVTSNRLLVVPLTVGGRKWGILTFDKYAFPAVSEPDAHFLHLLIPSLSAALEGIQFLMESRSRAQDEVETQATTALQRFLLPQIIQVPAAHVATNYQAARKSSGDWFGYHHHDKRKRVDFFIGDVTGHGVTSALLAGVASGAVYSLEAAFSSDAFAGVTDEERLLQMARIVNRVVFESGKEKLFMAMMFMSIDLETGEALFLNSGHQPFYHVVSATSKTASVMPNPGNALGYSLSPNFTTQTLKLNPGDLLFLYTAGLLSNQGPGEKKLGVRKLKSILEKSRDPLEMQGLVLDAAREIWQNQASADDVTTLVFKWLGPSRSVVDDAPATTLDLAVPVSRSA